MTPEEKAAFTQMERDIADLVKTQNINGHKLDQVLIALKGDEYGNIGFAQRIVVMENEIKSLREERTRNGVYIKIIIGLVVIIGTGVIGFILQTILKPK